MTRDEDGLRRYQEFLRGRDGEPDIVRRTLSRREEFFDDLRRHPVLAETRIDRDAYLRNLGRRRPEPGLDPRVLWLLASGRANQAERFSVGIAELYGKVPVDGSDPLRLHLHLQESYHSRILGEVIAMFGVPPNLRPPHLVMRMLVAWLAAVPESWQAPVAGAGEMVGCVLFRALRDRGLALFVDEPAVADRIRLLYDEILADEISHVGYVTARLGETGRSLMRALYRPLGRRLAAQEVPELRALLGPDELARLFSAPFRLADLAAELPGRACVAALI